LSAADIADFRNTRVALGRTLIAGFTVQGNPRPTEPRVGGVETIRGEAYAWTGGSAILANARTKPASMKAYRPQDFKSLAKAEKDCTEGLPESHRLSTPDKISSDTTVVSMQTWIERVKTALEERGMDSVFRMFDGTVEHYLLEEFGRAETDKVANWVIAVKARACEYDEQNLMMSGKMLLASLDLDMLKKTEREVSSNASGPEVFAAVINLHQALNSSAVRMLTEQLQKLKLTKEPGENVSTFSDKVLDIAKRIQGAGPITCPRDLPHLVYECFQGCSTPVFAMEATTMCFKATKGDPTVDDWEQGVSELKSTYRSLVTRKCWEAAKHHKEKVEAQAMQAQIKTLQKTVSDFSKPKEKTAGSGGSGVDTRECYHCGKKGHIKPNCPDKDKPKVKAAGQGGGSGGEAKDQSNSSGRKTPPKEGEAHTKTVDGEVSKWCGTCKRWSKGEKAHLTEEHVKGKGKAAAPKAAGALAAAEETGNDTGATLRLVSGYMAKIGQPLKRDSHVYCTECRGCVCNDGHHDQTFAHQEAKLRSIASGLQSQVQSKMEDVSGWMTIVRKKGVSGSLKDQAGQR
jgi:hypothetical protein